MSGVLGLVGALSLAPPRQASSQPANAKGRDLAKELITRSRSEGERVGTSFISDKVCFLRDYVSAPRCLIECFGQIEGKRIYEKEESNGYWFIAYRSKVDSKDVYLSAIPQSILVWDYTLEELGIEPSGDGIDPETPSKSCGLATSVIIVEKVGKPNLINEGIPFKPTADGKYFALYPF
jgi:hypothetical protein